MIPMKMKMKNKDKKKDKKIKKVYINNILIFFFFNIYKIIK